MIARNPYLIRAIYQWTVDSGYTPQLLVDAEYPGVDVPAEYIQDGQLVLNVHPRAVQGLNIGNEEVSLEARFGGLSRRLVFPVLAVRAIFARENGEGILLPTEDSHPSPEAPDSKDGKAERRPNYLRVVK